MFLKLVLYLFLPSVVFSAAIVPKGFDITILHNNDMHSRFDQTDVKTSECTKELMLRDLCFGGFARTAHLIKEFRGDPTNPVIYLNAGDTFTGTTWFSVYKDKIASELLNYLKPEAAVSISKT